MSFFRNSDEPGTNDISKHPGYASLPEDVRKEVNNRYETVYNNAVNRMGIRIAQGIAYETAKQMCEAFVAEKHIGFKKLAGEIEGEGKSKASADAIAASIGRKKYGAKAMKSAAKNHHALGEGEVDEADIEFEDPQGDYAKNPKGATYESEIQFEDPQGDYARNPEGATYENAQSFQDANDAMVGMTEMDCAHCHGAGCAKCHMNEVDDFGVTQQAHLNIPYPQTPGGDSDVIAHAVDIMYNPANAMLDVQGDHQDSGPKAIQKANHRMKGMNDTASQNEVEELVPGHLPVGDRKHMGAAWAALHTDYRGHPYEGPDKAKAKAKLSAMYKAKGIPTPAQNEQLDPVIAAAAGYIKHRAEVAGIMESVEDPRKKVSSVEELNEAFHEIGHGDHVTIRTPQNQERKGKAVMKSSHGGWVLNMGGPHGTPGLVDQKNYVKHTKAKNKAPNSLAMRRLTGEEVTIAGEYAKLMAEGLTDTQKKKLKDPICNNCAKVEGKHPHPGCKKFVRWDVSMVGKKPKLKSK